MGPEAWGSLLSGPFPRVEQKKKKKVLFWGITGSVGQALPSHMAQILETFYSYLLLPLHSLGDCCCGDLQGGGPGEEADTWISAACFLLLSHLFPPHPEPQGAEPRRSPKAWGVFI